MNSAFVEYTASTGYAYWIRSGYSKLLGIRKTLMLASMHVYSFCAETCF